MFPGNIMVILGHRHNHNHNNERWPANRMLHNQFTYLPKKDGNIVAGEIGEKQRALWQRRKQ